MSPSIPVREVVPWVLSVPYFVASDHASRLRSELRGAGFKVFDAEAADCADEKCLLEAVGNAMPFPDYFGRNWDAFDDCLGDLQREDFGPTALVINGADRMFRSSPHDFARSVHFLQTAVEQIDLSRAGGFQFEVFFVGDFRAAPAM